MDLSNYRRPLTAALIGLCLGVSAVAEAKVVATVNGKPITQEQLDEYKSMRPSSPRAPQEDDKALINELVTREVVLQQAQREHLDKNPQVKQQLQQMREQVLVSAAVQQYLQNNPISDKELRAEYDKLKGRMVSTEYRARHILVKDEAKAKKLIGELNNGADFAKLAKENSTGPTARKGGELGWFNPRQMVPPFSKALEGLKKGEYTKTPVKTRFGWHVIQLEGTRQSKPPTFEQVKPRLKQMVEQRHVGEYIQSLKDKADISIK